MAGKSLIGALRVTLGLDSANFSQGIARSRKEMTTMQKGAAALKGALVGMIGLETISQIRQMGREALDTVGALGEQAAQVGVSTNALQQYRYIASQVGVTNEEMDKGLQQLTRRIGEAATGNKAQAAAFDRLGVSLVDASGKVRSTEAVMLDVADAISKLPSSAEQASAAADVMGARLGQKLLPALQQGAKAIREMIAEAEKLGLVIDQETIKTADDYSDALERQDRIINAQMNATFAKHSKALFDLEMGWASFKTNGLIVIAETISALTNFFTVSENASKTMDGLGASAGKNGQIIFFAFQNMHKIVIAETSQMVIAVGQWIGRMVTEIQDWISNKLAAVWKSAEAAIARVKQKFFDLYDAVVGNSYIPDMVDEIGQHMRRLGKEMVDPATAATKAAGDAFAKMQAKVGGATEIQNVRVVESFSDMTNGVLREVDRLVKGIQSGNFLDIIGGVLGAVDGIAKLFNGGAGLSGLFGGGGGTSSGKIGNSTKPPGFANGGSMRLGGLAGIDRNLLSLNGSPLARVSAGETMTITPANDRGGAPVVFDLRGAVMTEDLLRQMNAIGARSAQAGARGGANLALSTLAKRQARALA